jgi:hypothetical protein
MKMVMNAVHLYLLSKLAETKEFPADMDYSNVRITTPTSVTRMVQISALIMVNVALKKLAEFLNLERLQLHVPDFT